MPLEATMMLIDNSEFMRNGDYVPTRFEAQKDAVTTVFSTKTDSNPENTVGVMTMAGKGPEVLVTHTKDLGQVLGALHKVTSSLGGQADIITAISIAQLALKHRTNKNLRQRIVVFVGSPLVEGADEKSLTKLAKKLKKNNVAVDVVSFGEDESRNQNEVPLRAFVDGANSGDNSHFLAVAPGSRLLSDAIVSSAILAGEGAAADVMDATNAEGGPSGAGGGDGFEFGVDPNLDPELALALRMSMEEERARQTAATGSSSATQQSAPSGASAPTTLETVPEVTLPPNLQQQASLSRGDMIPGAETEDEEERLLAQALALSTQDNNGGDVEMGDAELTRTKEEDEEMSEEEAIARAIQMSLEGEEGEGGSGSNPK